MYARRGERCANGALGSHSSRAELAIHRMLPGTGATSAARRRPERVNRGLQPSCTAARRTAPGSGSRSARRDLALELDRDLVLDLQRAHHRRELLDAEVLLAQREAARDLAAADLQRHAHRAALAGDREVPLSAAVFDGARREGDLRAAEHLAGDALLDVALVLV